MDRTTSSVVIPTFKRSSPGNLTLGGLAGVVWVDWLGWLLRAVCCPLSETQPQRQNVVAQTSRPIANVLFIILCRFAFRWRLRSATAGLNVAQHLKMVKNLWRFLLVLMAISKFFSSILKIENNVHPALICLDLQHGRFKLRSCRDRQHVPR